MIITSTFTLSLIAAALLFLIAMYCILFSRNLIRLLIGVELFTKAVTLLLIASGYISNRTATGQTLVITMIIIEVVVMVVAAGIIIGAYNKTGDINVKLLSNLKG